MGRVSDPAGGALPTSPQLTPPHLTPPLLPPHRYLHSHLLAYLIAYHPDEFLHFLERNAAPGSRRADRVASMRRWASLRLQTLYRTLSGMMKNRRAFELLLRAQLPSLVEADLDRILDSKFTLVAALQRYGEMRPDELADCELMLAEHPKLTIAYIEKVEGKFTDEPPRFFSCLVDATCELDAATGRRRPRLRIELPGHPVLGNGKSDNQNHAIVFSRGAIIQAIDANQEGYLEESLKVASALKEFELRGEAGASTGPAIVGFREHIFSGLGALGDFAASSELVFGSLTQRTMASTLWSRYHYGHPDLLDKLAMMAQGGVSKATRGLNLSEDVFAGMDSTLRGGRVVHREYYQVGKGRDMGFMSVLGFFCKLSMGTAQMSTSRQSYRLGVRLGAARLFGFFYGHVGFYLAQLHFYHVSYTLYALAFLGALADGCGLLPGAAGPAALLFSTVYGPLYGLFLLASVAPLVATLLAEAGLLAALVAPLRSAALGSPLFFAIQSRCIGHYLSSEFALGGAAYIPTGRSLAIEHQPFHVLYHGFASPVYYPGAELAALLVLAAVVSPVGVGWASLGFGAIMPLALLYGPALFNPRCFALLLQARDLKAWALWLVDDGPKGWGAHFAAICDKKAGARLHAALLPSKELLLAFPLLLIAHHAVGILAPARWWWLYTLLLALPLLPAAAVALLLGPLRLLRAGAWEAPLLAAACAALLAGEIVFLVLFVFAAAADDDAPSPPPLGVAQWAALLSARYFAWRAVANAAAYLVAGAPPGNAVGRAVRDVLRQTAAAHAFLGDVAVGLLLQLPLMVVAVVPLSSTLHFGCLFLTTRRQLSSSAETLTTAAEEAAAGKIPAPDLVRKATRRASVGVRSSVAVRAEAPRASAARAEASASASARRSRETLGTSMITAFLAGDGGPEVEEAMKNKSKPLPPVEPPPIDSRV